MAGISRAHEFSLLGQGRLSASLSAIHAHVELAFSEAKLLVGGSHQDGEGFHSYRIR